MTVAPTDSATAGRVPVDPAHDQVMMRKDPGPGDRDCQAALDRLVAVLERNASWAIAVSGGVDSMTLAHVAHGHARTRVTMYHAAGPAVPLAARQRVEDHAARHDWRLIVLDAGEQGDERYRANPVDRCYFCKSNLYARIRERTDEPIASGTNCDDLGDYRPGLRAASERGVIHPYVDAGLDKATVYAIARTLGLGDLERLPAQPCLASRIETGIAIAPDDLAFIDAVERRLEMWLGANLGTARGTMPVAPVTLRCRVTHGGVVIEIDAQDPGALAAAEAIGRDESARTGRNFAGVRPYRRGAAFLRDVTVAPGGAGDPGQAGAARGWSAPDDAGAIASGARGD